MRKILLIFVCSCSQLSWGLDALDGRQIICKASPGPVFPETGIQGFRFEGRQVKGDVIIVDNDTVTIKHYRTGPVKRIGLRKVEFWETNGASWELDRTSLVLQSPLNSSDLPSFQCEVALSIENYDDKMEELRGKNLEILQAELKKNKI